MHPWRRLRALRRMPVSREIRRIAIPLQLISFVCIASAGGGLWFAAQQDATHGFGTVLRKGAEWIARSWVLFFVMGLGAALFWSPRLIAAATRPRAP